MWWWLLAAQAGSASTSVVVERQAVPIDNLDWRRDDGTPAAYGDHAKNGIPDGWKAQVRSGKVQVRPTANGRLQVDFALDTRTTIASAEAPAAPGETFVLRTGLDLKGQAIQGSLGIGFVSKGNLIDYQNHRLDTELQGFAPIELRATAPQGTDAILVRFLMTGTTQGGSFELLPMSLERVAASSRRSALPLPQIYLITIETFRADHASLFGYERSTTPNLERLAREGAVFTSHHAPAPFTRPSLASLITSRFPDQVGVVNNSTTGLYEATTAAELLAERGYVTGAFLAQYVLAQQFGFNQGFHYYHHYGNDETHGNEIEADLYPWLEEHRADNRFVWIHFLDPHGPYRPLDTWKPPFEGDALWQADTRALQASSSSDPRVTGPFVPGYIQEPGELDRRSYVARYDAEIAYVDDRIGALIRWLEETGQKEQALVVVTADHGESMTDHDRYFCHGSLYEHDLHVPLVVWAPGRVAPGTRVDVQTSHIDLLPTLLDYAGHPTLATSAGLAGTSLRPWIDGRAQGPVRPVSMSSLGFEDRETFAIRGEGPLKLMVDAKFQILEAYDLAQDPSESVNLVSRLPAGASLLRDRFAAWWKVAGRRDPQAQQNQRQGELPPDEIERLRALGYVE